MRIDLYPIPIMGTAMGPVHSCDSVDVLMGKLDEDLIACAIAFLPFAPFSERQRRI